MSTCLVCSNVFFCQAEDGIRDGHVTGVQTCASSDLQKCSWGGSDKLVGWIQHAFGVDRRCLWGGSDMLVGRSEERRVGEEGGSREGADLRRRKRGRSGERAKGDRECIGRGARSADQQ